MIASCQSRHIHASSPSPPRFVSFLGTEMEHLAASRQQETTTETSHLEIAVCAAWRDQRFPRPLQTVAGQTVEVVNRGVWSNGFGPDFRDALILFDGRELRAGSVEVHRRTSGWAAHGHGTDPRYDDVILHVVQEHDGAETRRHDGVIVPVVELGATAGVPIDLRMLSIRWDRFGGDACAPDLATAQPNVIRNVLWRLGDVRLAGKSARFEASLTGLPPGEVLYRAIWDGLGYSANREPMATLAATLPLADIERILATARADERLEVARALLFGVAGFLPLSPSDAAFARFAPSDVAAIERRWQRQGVPWHGLTIEPTAWTRARVRPSNHPALRLSAGATLVAGPSDGLLSGLLGPLRAGTEPIDTLRKAADINGTPAIGADRCAAIVANAIIPFALALAEHTGDPDLGEAASRAWERLPAADANQVTRRAFRQVAGDSRLPGLGSRGQQGLIHLDAAFCSPRRCFECPIAHAVVHSSRQESSPPDGPSDPS
jgi:hypothetical protein